jgi:hypothetical protein
MAAAASGGIFKLLKNKSKNPTASDSAFDELRGLAYL